MESLALQGLVGGFVEIQVLVPNHSNDRAEPDDPSEKSIDAIATTMDWTRSVAIVAEERDTYAP